MKRLTVKQKKELLKTDPWYFISQHIITQDPIQGPRSFPNYDFLKTLIETTHQDQYLLVPKSRQMMVTWTMLAYFIWSGLFYRQGIYLVLSRNERCAEELLQRIRFMLDQLPDDLRPELKTNSQSEIAFGLTRILSLPATPHSPRMYSPTGVFWDEMAFTRYDEYIWTALKPALDHGGKFIGVSSSGGALNLFAKMVTGNDQQTFPHIVGELEGGKSDSSISNSSLVISYSLFTIHQIHYSMHPDKQSEAWKSQASKGLSLAKWDREQEISFTAETDLVYNELSLQKHIMTKDWKYRNDYKTFRAIDFGYRHPVVLWIQKTHKGNFIVFDEWMEPDRTTQQLFQAMYQKDSQHGIREADVLWTACDPAGAAVQDSGISPVSYLRNQGVKLIHRPSLINTGIELVKQALLDANGETKLFISPRCKNLITDFQRYRWSLNGEEPAKDGISDHSMDALRYFFVNYETPREYQHQPRVASSPRW